MKQGTTPTISLTVCGQNLTSSKVFVTFKADGKVLTKSGNDISMVYDDEATVIATKLAQDETLMFHPGMIQVEVRWITEEGFAGGTNIAEIEVTPALLKRVIAYE